MAIYHLHVSKISRVEGRSATAAAAYRSGEKIRDERTKETHDYTKKKGIESKELILPGGRKEERALFWNRVEGHHKRGDALVAREIEVSLPAELTKEQRRALAVFYAKELAERYGVGVDVAIHAPSRQGDQRNHHAHLLLSACRVSRDGALGKKAVELDPIHCQRQKIESLVERERPRWAELVNQELELNREKGRVDHRTLLAQGIERAPTQHLGPRATAIERKTGDLCRTTQERDQQLQELEQARLAREQEERQREKEWQEKAAQEKAKQQREQATKAQELAEKRRLEREQELTKSAPKAVESTRTPPRVSAWRGPTSKPAPQKAPSIEPQPKETSPTQKEHDQEQLSRVQEQAEQRRQEREQQERAQEELRAREAAERERQEKETRERVEKAAQERTAEQARKENIKAALRERAAQLKQKEQNLAPIPEQEPPKPPPLDKEQLRQQLREKGAQLRQEQQAAQKEQAPAPEKEKPGEQNLPLSHEESLAVAQERYLQKKAEPERTQPKDKNKDLGPER